MEEKYIGFEAKSIRGKLNEIFDQMCNTRE